MTQTQHYKYLSCYQSNSSKPLYTTKKGEVKKWLHESLGVAVAAHGTIMARVSDPTEATVHELLLEVVKRSGACRTIVDKIISVCKGTCGGSRKRSGM
jgi:hypothetical protein